jgi:ubiquinone/menaquinone biosynthesis C-methylase UbiE
MIPNNLFNFLQCVDCGHSSFNKGDNSLQCQHCDKSYPLKDGIPSMMKGGPEKQNWNPWDNDKIQMMGNSYYKRAKGELPEKESSKSYAKLIKEKELFSPETNFLDIGCATGHFLRSFRNIVDSKIHYTGVDVTEYYLHWGKEVYGVDEYCSFVHCDALHMPFKDNSYDYVIVNLFHFFPKVDDALQEAMRVAKKMVIWRTPIGQVNYMIKFLLNEQSFERLGVLTPDRENFDHSVYMLYTKDYIKGLTKHLGGSVSFIEQDLDFEDFDNTSLEEFKGHPSTKTIAGMQINGNLYLDWHYIGIQVN